jgi:hypothetical protein
MFWRRLADLIGTIRTDFMIELERNPLAVRQGAAAVACIAAAAVAMPVIANRTAEQRDGAEWSARAMAFQTEMRGQIIADSDPAARVELVAMRTADGVRARGSAGLIGPEGFDRRAMMVHAALRGPLAAPELESRREATIDPRQLRCLSEAIYYEARGETYRGQVAVGEVVMNRVRSRHYPDTICGVVYQGSTRATGCQFTFTCDGSLTKRPRGRGWERAQHIARQVMMGYTRPVTRTATHYHTTAIDPYWSDSLVETTRIGTHIFYRFPNRAERAVLMASARRAPRAASTDAVDVLSAEDAAPLAETGDVVVDDAALIEAGLAPAAAEPTAESVATEPVDAPIPAATSVRAAPVRETAAVAPPERHLGADRETES